MAQLAAEAIRVATPVRPADTASLAIPAGKSSLALVIGVFALVGLLSLVYISLASVVSSEGYEVGTLESARDYWKLQNDQIRLQVAEARSLATVEREAKRLGMGPPAKVIFLSAAPTPAPAVEPGNPAPEDSTRSGDLFAWLRGPW